MGARLLETWQLPEPLLEAVRYHHDPQAAPIARTEMTVAADPPAVTSDDISRYHYDDCAQLVLVNGRLTPEHSRLEGLPDGVVVSSLAAAWESHPELVERHLGAYAKFDVPATEAGSSTYGSFSCRAESMRSIFSIGTGNCNQRRAPSISSRSYAIRICTAKT